MCAGGQLALARTVAVHSVAMVPGTLVANRFRIETAAGGGAMGLLFRARDERTERPIALKVMRHIGDRAVRRFAQEAELLSRVRHPGIVEYVAHGEMNGMPFLAMEWLEGRDLATVLGGRPMSSHDALTVARLAAHALGSAHRLGVVHRDIKPSNLFLVGGDPRACKVVDFGIARLRDAEERLTQTGNSIGTPGYIAPEQARGEGHITGAADVFSLGCVFYECLTGRAPFHAETALAALAKVIFDEPVPLRQIWAEAPAHWDALIARTLQKDPTRRPADGAALAMLLDEIELEQAELAPRLVKDSPAITGQEKRLISVVAVSRLPPAPIEGTEEDDAPALDTAITVEASARVRAMNMLQGTGRAFGARCESLGAHSAILLFTGSATAKDMAAQAARCALVLRRMAPHWILAVATDRVAEVNPLPIGFLLDRVVHLIADEQDAAPVSRSGRPLPLPIALDDASAGLLDADFEIHSGPERPELRGEQIGETHRTLLGKSTPFVGRTQELAALRALFDSAIAGEGSRAALVIAPAGVGKSRLRTECVRALSRHQEPPRVALARANPVSPGAPMMLIASMVRDLAAISIGDAPSAMRYKLRLRISLDVAPEHVTRIAHFLGELCGAAFPDRGDVQLASARRDATLMGDQVRRAFIDYIEHLVRREPTVLVLEDLHWGDLASVNLIDDLLRNVRDAKLMILATGRPETLELFPRLWANRGLQMMQLGALSRRASEQLIRTVLGDNVADETVARIVRDADGNPFYTEELIRAAASGTPRTDPARPSSVLAMVESRLSPMDPEAKIVLRAASIFGERFSPGGVERLIGEQVHTSRLPAWLRELVAQDILVRAAAGASGDDQYAFRHALMRDAAYRMLTDDDRALGHQLAAKWLEECGDVEPVALAEHYSRAGSAALAVPWYILAAERALKGDDLAAAQRYAEAGVRSNAYGAQLGALRVIQAETFQWAGDFERAMSMAEEALNLCVPGENAWVRATAPYLSGVLAMATEPPRALVDRIISLCDVNHSTAPSQTLTPEVQLLVMGRCAAHLVLARHAELSQPLLERLRSVTREQLQKDPIAGGWVRCTQSLEASRRGDASLALSLSQEGESLFLTAGDLRTAAVTQINSAVYLNELGAYEEADHAGRQLLAVAERMGLGMILPHAQCGLGISLLGLDVVSEALSQLQKARSAFEQGKDVRMASQAACYEIWALIRLGQTEEAGALVKTTLQQSEPTRTHPLALATAARWRQVTAATDDDRRAAAALANRALLAMDAQGGTDEDESFVRLVALSTCLQHLGRDGAAALARSTRSRLLQRAQLIEDPRRRQTFLTRVRDNAEILKITAALVAPS